MPKVSVIIPCYNQGCWLEEAVDSVLAQTFRDFEIIVVNDGSTDIYTNELLAGYNRPQVHVIHTKNQGLPAARNTGIAVAQGEYILPLDADDTIAQRYLELAVDQLDNKRELGIVYCHGELFGDRHGRIKAATFSSWGMLISNLIFCSAMYRKKDWELVGGYNPEMIYGCEDWDFWLSILELQRTVYRIPKVLFHYRVREASMNQAMDYDRRLSMFQRIMNHHPKLYHGWRGQLAHLGFRFINSAIYRQVKDILTGNGSNSKTR